MYILIQISHYINEWHLRLSSPTIDDDDDDDEDSTKQHSSGQATGIIALNQTTCLLKFEDRTAHAPQGKLLSLRQNIADYSDSI